MSDEIDRKGWEFIAGRCFLSDICQLSLNFGFAWISGKSTLKKILFLTSIHCVAYFLGGLFETFGIDFGVCWIFTIPTEEKESTTEAQNLWQKRLKDPQMLINVTQTTLVPAPAWFLALQTCYWCKTSLLQDIYYCATALWNNVGKNFMES